MRKKKGVEGYMVIKVDLSKAYDKLWDFVLEALRDLKLLENFIQVITKCSLLV